MKQYLKILLYTPLLTTFYGVAKADMSDLSFGVTVEPGISFSDNFLRNKEWQNKKLKASPKSEGGKFSESIHFAIKAGAFVEYDFFNYLGIKTGINYNRLLLGNKISNITDASNDKLAINNTTIINSIAIPLKLKIMPFGKNSGFFWKIGPEFCFNFTGAIVSITLTEKDKGRMDMFIKTKYEENVHFKEKIQDKFKDFTILLSSEFTQEFDFGLILGINVGISFGILSDNGIEYSFYNSGNGEDFTKEEKNEEIDGIKYKNIHSVFVTFMLGYNFGKLL